MKRRVREKVCGTAVDQRRWEIVCVLDGEIKIVTSNSLKVVPDEFAIPLHELVSFSITNLHILFYFLFIANNLNKIITGEFKYR